MQKPAVTALGLYLLINGTFVYKYASRVTDLSWLLVILYSSIIILILAKPPLLLHRLLKHRWSHLAMAVITVVAGVVIWHFLPPASLRVDRWSVISSFLDRLLAGQFPYTARSHMGNQPGPFPGYFAIALPFYLIGEIGYLSVLGFLGFVWMARQHLAGGASVGMSTLLLFVSVAWWWELTVRSTLVVNMVLAMAFLLWLSNGPESRTARLIMVGLVGGFLVSTRGIVGVIMLGGLSWFYFNTRHIERTLTLAVSIGVGFAVTLLPFVVWDPTLFAQQNPIALQAGFLPAWALPAILGVMAASGVWIKNIFQYFCLLGHALFLIVFASMLRTAAAVGWAGTIREDGFDISYFLFALPFLIVTLASGSEMDRRSETAPAA